MKKTIVQLVILVIVLALIELEMFSAQTPVTNVPNLSSQIATTGCDIQSGTGTTNTTNSQLCQAGVSNWYGFWAVNTTGTLAYWRYYNLATAPTCSSSTGFLFSVPIPANTSGSGIVVVPPFPRNFSTGIGWCITGAGANNDNSNAPAGVYGMAFVK
jgi:hypothetical protein